MQTTDGSNLVWKRICNPFASVTSDRQCFDIAILPGSLFPPRDDQLDYGRNVCVQLVRDELQPRLNYWAQRFNESRNAEPVVQMLAIERMLKLLLRCFDEMFAALFPSQEFVFFPAFKRELRLRLLPKTTLDKVHHMLLVVLSYSYQVSFKQYLYKLRNCDHHAPGPMCLTCMKNVLEAPDVLPPSIRKFNAVMKSLDAPESLLRGLARSAAHTIARRQAKMVASENCLGQEQGKMYKTVLAGVAVVSAWLQQYDSTQHEAEPSLETTREIERLAEREVIDVLSYQIYDLAIVKYPASLSSIQLLEFAMQKQDFYGRDQLVSRLIADVHARLLHVGTPTAIILQAYAAAVDSLRHLDPSCVIMHRVCRVIREYIKKRPDTVRQIINLITTERKGQLDQLDVSTIKHRGAIIDADDLHGVNDEYLPCANEFPWHQWQPDPPDAEPSESGRFRQNADVFNMLVSVYGSKESFVKEYRQILAERLSAPTKDSEFEQRYLELLKLRFSDGELQHCEVMLGDVKSSEAYERMIRREIPMMPVFVRVISANFWPPMEQEQGVRFPAVIERWQQQYTDIFVREKTNRTLQWMPGSGTIDMTLTIDGVSVDKVVPTALATVLYLFLGKEEWEQGEVADELGIPKNIAKKRLDYWLAQGVLSQYLPQGATSEVYRITKTACNMERYKGAVEGEESDSDMEEQDGDPADAVDQLEQYWKYTKSYISNQENGEMKAERLLSIYRMFASPSSQTLTLDHVLAFLGRKVKLGLLILNSGMYRVVKDPPAEGKA